MSSGSDGTGPDAIRWLREISGLTQRQLSRLSGVSERTIRGLERGQIRRPHQSSLLAIVDAAGLQPPQRAAFLRAWSPDRTRTMTDLSAAERELVLAEATVQAEIEECLLASWTRIHVDEHRRRVRSHNQCGIQARRDNVDSYLLPLLGDHEGRPPAAQITETVGCRLRQRHEFATSGLLLLELELDHPLRTGESAAFEYTLEPGPGEDLFGDTRTNPTEGSVQRLVHRIVDLTVVEVTFERPPAVVWEVERVGAAEARRVREVALDGEQHVQLVRRYARPGSYGFHWSWK